MAVIWMTKSYSEMLLYDTFEERYEYLRISGQIGVPTFGSARFLNQLLYHDQEWKAIRNRVILRDNGLDLGIEGREIKSRLHIHHINPISKDDIINRAPKVFDMNNLICCSEQTHKAIHYGDNTSIIKDPIARSPNDTCPWK